MADPFEVRMRFSTSLGGLNATLVAAQKAAQLAVKYRDLHEDLHSCILEQVGCPTTDQNGSTTASGHRHAVDDRPPDPVNWNTRANILYFVEVLLEAARKEGVVEYARMMERDLARVTHAVIGRSSLGPQPRGPSSSGTSIKRKYTPDTTDTAEVDRTEHVSADLNTETYTEERIHSTGKLIRTNQTKNLKTDQHENHIAQDDGPAKGQANETNGHENKTNDQASGHTPTRTSNQHLPGAMNVKAARSVIAQLQRKEFFPSHVTSPLLAELDSLLPTVDDLRLPPPLPDSSGRPKHIPSDDRPSGPPTAQSDGGPTHGPNTHGSAHASTHGSSSQSGQDINLAAWAYPMDRRLVDQRLEEDRERHKRLRETRWAVVQGADPTGEWQRLWEETSDAGDDDYRVAREEYEEQEAIMAAFCHHTHTHPPARAEGNGHARTDQEGRGPEDSLDDDDTPKGHRNDHERNDRERNDPGDRDHDVDRDVDHDMEDDVVENQDVQSVGRDRDRDQDQGRDR